MNSLIQNSDIIKENIVNIVSSYLCNIIYTREQLKIHIGM